MCVCVCVCLSPPTHLLVTDGGSPGSKQSPPDPFLRHLSSCPPPLFSSLSPPFFSIQNFVVGRTTQRRQPRWAPWDRKPIFTHAIVMTSPRCAIPGKSPSDVLISQSMDEEEGDPISCHTLNTARSGGKSHPIRLSLTSTLSGALEPD